MPTQGGVMVGVHRPWAVLTRPGGALYVPLTSEWLQSFSCNDTPWEVTHSCTVKEFSGYLSSDLVRAEWLNRFFNIGHSGYVLPKFVLIEI